MKSKTFLFLLHPSSLQTKPRASLASNLYLFRQSAHFLSENKLPSFFHSPDWMKLAQ